jgi:phosphoribosyl 1,2-cyclic phosphate phosphodiesterase
MTTATTATHTLTFLGTGASCGVPSYYCGCKACEEARVNPRAARDCSGLLITGSQHTLIDAAPELRTQLIREQISTIDQVLFTHEHFDHVGGIPQLEFLVRLGSQTPLPVYAGKETLASIARQFDFMSDVLAPHLLRAFETVSFDGVTYTALPATHSEGAFGFLIETRQSRVAYFPDTGPLAPRTREALDNLDILIIDATFNGRNWMPATHHTIDEAIALALKLKPQHTYLTHLAMHYDEPITLAELEEKLKPYQGDIAIAFDGFSLTLT